MTEDQNTPIPEFKKFDPIEEAYTIHRLEYDFGKSDEEIRKMYGDRSKAWLANMKSLLKLSIEHQNLIRTNDIPVSVGYILADMRPQDRQPLLDLLAERGEKITVEGIRILARELQLNNARASLSPKEMRRIWERLGKSEDPKIRWIGKTLARVHIGELDPTELETAMEHFLSQHLLSI